MNEKSKKYIIVGLILLLVVGFIAYKNVTKIQNYKENGKEVECTVSSVIQGRKMRLYRIENVCQQIVASYDRKSLVYRRKDRTHL